MRRTSSIIPTSIKKIAMEDRLGLLSSSVDSIGFGGGLLGYWVIGLLGYWVIKLLGYFVIRLLGYFVIRLLGYWVIRFMIAII